MKKPTKYPRPPVPPSGFDAIEGIGIPAPAGNFLPAKRVGELVFLAGQTCERDGKMLYKGQVGADLSVEDGYAAAKVCMENLLAALRDEVAGDWTQVLECVRITGYVNASAHFPRSPAVINGASDFIVELMGDAGRHARTAIGVSALPGDAAVEVEAIFRVRGR